MFDLLPIMKRNIVDLLQKLIFLKAHNRPVKKIFW